jgi:aromatic ring-opening dioxygenase LigB subunit
LRLSGYPSGVVVLSIEGKTLELRINRMESGFTLPFSFSKKRRMVITTVAMTNIILVLFSKTLLLIFLAGCK